MARNYNTSCCWQHAPRLYEPRYFGQLGLSEITPASPKCGIRGGARRVALRRLHNFRVKTLTTYFSPTPLPPLLYLPSFLLRPLPFFFYAGGSLLVDLRASERAIDFVSNSRAVTRYFGARAKSRQSFSNWKWNSIKGRGRRRQVAL